MKSQPARLIAVLVLATGFVSCAYWTAKPEKPEFTFADGILTIKTSRYQLEWKDGCMTRLVSLLPDRTELTVTTGAWAKERFPNGLGSFHGQEAAAKAQHHPWGFQPLPASFPAQHVPDATTKITFEKLPGGARLTYRGLSGDAQAALIQELLVEPETGDLLIRQSGQSPQPGVFGIAFSMLNLLPDLRLVAPYFGGQRWGPDFAKGHLMTLAWPQFWSAGFIIGETSSGGSFAVWADDPRMRPKYLRRYHDDKAQVLGFEACEDFPYEDRTQLNAFTWRFNTFAGSWLEPAERYKQWLIQAYQLVPRKQRAPKWADDIALIWQTYVTEEALKKMAEVINPKHVLIMDWGWLQGFNRRIPEYIPQNSKYAETTALAHKYDYHVGAYTSCALIDQAVHPQMMKEYGLRYFHDGGLFNATWSADADQKAANPENWLVYIHPGSQKWREFYAEKMRWVNAQWGVDYLYQDVSGCGTGSSGLIEGKNFHEAVVAAEDAIRKAAPNAALGGEFWNEVNVCREDSAVQSFLGWGGLDHAKLITRPDRPHPILSYIFSEFCLYWSQNPPIRAGPLFHLNENINEVIGALPTWNTSPDDRTSEARLVLERARLWAEGFRPYFPKRQTGFGAWVQGLVKRGRGALPTQWEDGVVAYMKDNQNRVVKYVREKEATYCYEQTPAGTKLRYARLHDRREFQHAAPVFIDGWLAYDDRGPIGLDPGQWYCVFPGSPPVSLITLTNLPEGAHISGSRASDTYCLVEIEGQGTGQVRWRASCPPLAMFTAKGRQNCAANEVDLEMPSSVLFVFKERSQTKPSEELLLEDWQHYLVNNHQISGRQPPVAPIKRNFGEQVHSGYIVMPPAGGIGSEYSIDGCLNLPNDPRLALKFGMGRLGGAGDGVNFVVRVNGKEIWRQLSPSEAGWKEATLPLKNYAGQMILLSLAVDCGVAGNNTSNDQAAWGEVKLVTEPAAP
ncbi:MAG: hypothetical protein HY360_16510 [Verrucomicrobia bacterium]|nr:hypothetical protein [Verrucomicrobiota bacterium]